MHVSTYAQALVFVYISMEILASLQEPIHIHSGLKGHEYVPIAALTYPHLILSVDIPTSQPKRRHPHISTYRHTCFSL